VLSLAGLAVSGGSGGSAWVAGDLDFRVTFADPTYVTAPSATIKVIGDAPQLCTRVTALVSCPVVSSGPVPAPVGGSLTVLGAGSSTNASNVTTPMTQGSASVTISAPALSACSGSLSGRAVDASGSPRPVVGALVTLRDSSGVVVTYPMDWSDVSRRGQPVSAVTDDSGNYSFAGLAAASYKVSFANTASATAVSSTVTAGVRGRRPRRVVR